MGTRLELKLSANTQQWEKELNEASKAVDELVDRATNAGVKLDEGFTKEVEELDRRIVDLVNTARTTEDIRVAPNAGVEIGRMRLQLEQAHTTFHTFSKSAAQDSRGFTAALDKNRFVAIEAARAVDDFFAAFQTGGVAGGLRGAANNLTAIASQFGPIGALAGTAGVIIGSVLIPKLFQAGEEAEDAGDKIEKLKADLEAFDKFVREMEDRQLKIELGDTAFETRQRGLEFGAVKDPLLAQQQDLQATIDKFTNAIERAERMDSPLPLREALGDEASGFNRRDLTEQARGLIANAESDLAKNREKLANAEEVFRRDEAERARQAENEKRKKQEEEARKHDREANLEKQKRDKQADDERKRLAEEREKQREQAEKDRQKRIDDIAKDLVGTFREVIKANGNLDETADRLRQVFTQLGTDTKEYNAAVQTAKQLAEAENQRQEAQQQIVEQARQQQAEAAMNRARMMQGQQAQAQAVEGMSVRERMRREQIRLQRGGLSRRDARRAARDLVEADVTQRETTEDQEVGERLLADAERFRQERGGTLTPAEERQLARQQASAMRQHRAAQRARRRGESPLGGAPEGGGDPAQEAADNATDAMANGLDSIGQAQGAFVGALDGMANMLATADANASLALSAVQQIMGKLNQRNSAGNRRNR